MIPLGGKTIEKFCAQSIGISFKPHGRDRDGWDCWGLVCYAYKEVYGVTLKWHNDKYDSIKDYDTIKKAFAVVIKDSLKEGWQKVEDQRAGDIIVFFMRGRPIHVGLAVDTYRMMHVEHGIQTCMQSTSEIRIEGIYRYGN